jgi:hypothetical protein
VLGTIASSFEVFVLTTESQSDSIFTPLRFGYIFPDRYQWMITASSHPWPEIFDGNLLCLQGWDEKAGFSGVFCQRVRFVLATKLDIKT